MTHPTPPGPTPTEPSPPEPTVPEVGTVITTKPWAAGRQHEQPLCGLVLARHFPPDGPYVLVWFPTLGAPALGNPARTVQAIWAHEIHSPCPLAQMPATWVIAAERAARRTRAGGGYDIGSGAGRPLARAARNHRDQRARARAHTDSTEQPHSQQQHEHQPRAVVPVRRGVRTLPQRLTRSSPREKRPLA